MNIPKVAVLVPTKNRQKMFLQQLLFYAMLGSRHVFYVVDSSDRVLSQSEKRSLDMLSGHLSIKYFYQPCLNDSEAISYMLERATENHCAFIGDDDFFVPSGLDSASKALWMDKSKRAVGGRSWIFTSNVGTSGRQKLSRWSIRRYVMNPQIDESPADRIRSFSEQYWVTLFCVHRTEEFKEDWQANKFRGSRYATELLPNLFTVCRGKIDVVDEPFLFRQNHSARGASISPLDRLISDNLIQAMGVGREYIADELKDAGLPLGNAREVAYFIFEKYFGKWVSKYYLTRSPIQRVFDRVGSVVGLLHAGSELVFSSSGSLLNLLNYIEMILNWCPSSDPQLKQLKLLLSREVG
jgi:glycosyltransferase domain-containing protein